jgi:putative two-component system response regulator
MSYQAAVTPPPNLSLGSPRATVLIADGDPDYRQLYSDLLRSEGFQTFCAKDVSQALAVLHRQRIDIALVDVMMPKTNGMTVCRELKNNPDTRLVPILLLTGESDPDRIMGLESGADADAFLKKPVNNGELITRVRALLDKKRFTDNLESAEKMLLTFAETVEAKNPWSAGHGYRVSQTAVSLAVRMGLPAEDWEWIRRGALLHDIGKAGVPDEILLKLGPLRPEEKIILNSHTYLGERICAPLSSFVPLLQIIRNHHERLDGSGYPDGLRGTQISALTRIVTVADVYDGLTNSRPYRGSFTHTQALHQMRREAEQGWWDLRIIDALGRIASFECVPGRA